MLVAFGQTAALITLSVNSFSVSDPFRSRALTPAEPAPTAKKVAINIVFFIESSKKTRSPELSGATPPLSKMRATNRARNPREKTPFSRYFCPLHGSHLESTHRRLPDSRRALRIPEHRAREWQFDEACANARERLSLRQRRRI